MRHVLIAKGKIENCMFNRTRSVYWCGGEWFRCDWEDTTHHEKEGCYFFHETDFNKACQRANVIADDTQGRTWKDEGIQYFYEYHV